VCDTLSYANLKILAIFHIWMPFVTTGGKIVASAMVEYIELCVKLYDQRKIQNVKYIWTHGLIHWQILLSKMDMRSRTGWFCSLTIHCLFCVQSRTEEELKKRMSEKRVSCLRLCYFCCASTAELLNSWSLWLCSTCVYFHPFFIGSVSYT